MAEIEDLDALVSACDRDDLLAELVIPSARGNRKSTADLEIEVIRALTTDDLPALIAPPPLESTALTTGPDTMRHAHHQLAMLIAQGHEMVDVSYITGYSISYISTLKNSPAFEELLSAYQTERELVFIDVAERMKDLGLNALDELQARLLEEPKAWTRREIMDLAELMLLKGRAGPGSAQGAGNGAGSGPGISVEISFVKPNSSVVIDQ